MSEPIAAITQLWRFPVKSMRGEKLDTLELTNGGVTGDRWFALRELANRKLADARRSPRLLQYSATVGANDASFALVTLPDGREFRTDDDDFLEAVSTDLGRKMGLESHGHSRELGYLDDAPILIASQQTLATLKSLNPNADFDVRRFRPNILVDVLTGSAPYPEDLWLGRAIGIGRRIRLQVTKACGRCAMTALAQDELPTDFSILNTVLGENTGNLGVYATVIEGGHVRVGDKIWLE